MSATSRQLIRNLDAFEQTAVVARYPNINEARTAMPVSYTHLDVYKRQEYSLSAS